MFITIVAVIAVLIGIGLLVFGTGALRLGGAAAIVVAALALILSSVTTVEAKNVGVVTTFGRPSETTLEPGLHFKAPWQKVTDIDGTIQTRQYHGENALGVRIGDGTKADVSLTLRWRVNPSEADVVFADYRSDNPTSEVGDKLVSPQLKAALQKTLGTYNPCASLEVVKVDDDGSKSAAPTSFAPDMDAIGSALDDDLQGRSDLVEILDVAVTYVAIGGTTQKCLDDFTASVGRTVVAQQNKITSAAQAAANDELEGSISPEVNQARCLDALNTAIEKGYQFNAGFSCFGGGGSVVVPSAK